VILHLSTSGEDETLCGKETCRAAPRGWMDYKKRPNQPAEGDEFVANNPEWSWCDECRDAGERDYLMGNYPTYFCRLFWENNDDLFTEIELRSLPREGEKVWFEYRNSDGDHECNYLVEVVEIVHVGETADEFSCVQLTVVENTREEVEDDFGRERELDEYDPGGPKIVYECENCKFRTNVPVSKCCAHEKNVVVMM